MSKLTNLIFLLLVAFGFSGCISFSVDIGGSKDKTPAYYPPPQPPMPYYYY